MSNHKKKKNKKARYPLSSRSNQLINFRIYLLRLNKWVAMTYINMLSAAAIPNTSSKPRLSSCAGPEHHVQTPLAMLPLPPLIGPPYGLRPEGPTACCCSGWA
ncbi:MAG: hypothetical protein H0X50_03935 [Nitrosopumilus sp.]|nr:hypothetical protein [Nitrosopumilus sp.]